ncbi:hypothetical protein ZIOFF_047472 [Zingiber officinale]|uniref:Uncharacterized protein n=1 Tax=Zingiber officinale TaxID=94328 RepID=A0A8J5FQW6_ZINOF|nr:hypothetical protein ZIOFF_047472 [Zingiber officinale]
MEFPTQFHMKAAKRILRSTSLPFLLHEAAPLLRVWLLRPLLRLLFHAEVAPPPPPISFLRRPLLRHRDYAALSSFLSSVPPSPPTQKRLRRPLLRHRSVCAALSSDTEASAPPSPPIAGFVFPVSPPSFPRVSPTLGKTRPTRATIHFQTVLRSPSVDLLLGRTSNGVDTPQVGMCFSAEEEVRDFYKSYAQSLGFGISKLGSKKGDDGQLKYFSFGCSKNAAKDVLKKAYYNMIAIIDQSLQDLERKVVY